MGDHPPQKDEHDEAGVERNGYAVFKCVDCWHRFAANIPALFEDLPLCPICLSGSKINNILLPRDELIHDYYFSDVRARRKTIE